MWKKTFLIVFVIICLILSISEKLASDGSRDNPEAVNTQDNQSNGISTNVIESASADVVESASIENIMVEHREISFQVKNLTTDNILISAYFEYVRLDGEKEQAGYPFRWDKLNLAPSDTSDIVVFNPQKALGNYGSIRFTHLIFEDEKDNYIYVDSESVVG